MSPLPPRLSHRSHRTLIVGAGASFVIIAGLLALVTRPAPESRQPASRPALTVTLEPPQRLRWEHSIEAHGALEPWQEQVIGARSSGLPLAEVMVEVGDTVRERMHKLATSGAVSRQDVQQAETEADTTEAQVALARAQLSAKRLLLAYAEVRAADDGVVSARSATPGAVANAGDELFRIIRQHRLEWRAELTPLQLRQVRAGQQVTLELPDGGFAPGVVRQEAPRLDPQTRLATVYADVGAPSQARAGMYASGRIALGSSEAVTVGSHSVVVRDGRSWIFVADASVARALQVTVGRRQGARSEIVSPLPQGVAVVGQGAAFLKDGDQIHVAPVAAIGGPRA